MMINHLDATTTETPLQTTQSSEPIANPVLALRTSLGLGRWQFSKLTNCELQAIQRAEAGRTKVLSWQIRDILRRYDIDPDEAELQYQAWKREQANALAQSIAA